MKTNNESSAIGGKDRERLSTIILAAVAVVCVGTVAIVAAVEKKKVLTPEQIQQRLEQITADYMRENIKSPDNYQPISTAIADANWIDGENTPEITAAEQEYATLYGTLNRMIDDRSIPVDQIQVKMNALDSLDSRIKLLREKNRIQNGWIVQHVYTNGGTKSAIWLICTNEKDAITGLAMKYIQSIIEQAYAKEREGESAR